MGESEGLVPDVVRRLAGRVHGAICETLPNQAVYPLDSNGVGGKVALVSLLIFICVFILNQADRQVISVLIPSGLQCQDDDPTPDCIDMTDADQGLLTGPAFTVVFTLSSLPLSWLADRVNRLKVLSIGLVFWSVMMVVSYFIEEFWQLLILRMLLGIGEATCNPSVYSMLSDLFPVSRRALALSIYNFGVYIGGGLGYISGIINSAVGWRWTFVILGLPGFLLTVVLLSVLNEPQRGQSETFSPKSRYSKSEHTKAYSMKEALKLLVMNPSFITLCIASAVRMLSGYALGGWLATYYERQFNLGSDEYGLAVGLIVIFGGTIGCLIGGHLSDVFMSSTPAAKAYVIAITQVIAAPFIVGVFLASTPHASYVLLFFAYITAETWLGAAAAIVQDIMPASLRAFATAFYTTVNTLIGGLGPLVVGALLGDNGLATQAYGKQEGLKYTMIYLMPTCYLLSAGLFYLVGVFLRRA